MLKNLIQIRHSGSAAAAAASASARTASQALYAAKEVKLEKN